MITAAALQAIYPNIVIGESGSDCVLLDGVIAEWNYEQPQPTQAELESASVPASKLAKIAELKQACTTAIQSGFTSSALGLPHLYDSELPQDQINLTGAVIAGIDMNFTCTDSDGNKWQRPHTAAQMAQVYVDGVAHMQYSKSHLYTRLSLVNAATTIEAVNGISW